MATKAQRLLWLVLLLWGASVGCSKREADEPQKVPGNASYFSMGGDVVRGEHR